MCGIIGYIGEKNALPILIQGLKKLEYRGYDSAGIAVVNGSLEVFKEKGDIDSLERKLPPLNGNVGIGHTRWATCGPPSRENAHPFVSQDNNIALVHNGIIENHIQLRRDLEKEGYSFTSETDTEVLVHLISKYYDGDLHKAVRRALRDVRGTYAIAAVEAHSEQIVVARNENPLVLGIGVSENFVASDVTAMLEYTSDVVYLLDGETAIVSPTGVSVYGPDGNVIYRPPSKVDWSVEEARKGGFEHYMLKEIFEQPHAISETLVGYLGEMEELNIIPHSKLDSMKILACGTSYNAGMVGKYIIEELTGIPVQVELASEYRYSKRTNHCPLVVLISQSGETADTLAACKEAKSRGSFTLAITNVVGSSITREADAVLMTHAGPEISVAATKTYTAQLVAMYILAGRLAHTTGHNSEEIRRLKASLRTLPLKVSEVLDRAADFKKASQIFRDARSVFFIGRNRNYPTMLEGALKMKEISYIHAEGYAAGELKHGPLALLDESTPLVAACLPDHTYDKMLTNVSEVAARGSPVLMIVEDGNTDCETIADYVIRLPAVDPLLSPVTLGVALQLLAYYVAKEKGLPIDKPRNLAKSVTVE